MKEKKPSAFEKVAGFMGSKGFYIVLFLCVAVIGVSAWVLSYTMNKTGLDLSESLNETLNSRVTASVPTPTAPQEVYRPTEAPIVVPPVTAAPSDITDSDAHTVFSDYGSDYSEDSSEYGYGESGGVWYDEDEVYESWAEDDSVPEPAPAFFVWPVNGHVETAFSVDTLLYSRTLADWRTHSGIDIAASMGAKVMAIAGGTVEKVYDDRLLGTTVVIKHGGGLTSTYSNLAAMPPVTVGDRVEAGEIIGSIGQTALAESGDITHLHLEMTFEGGRVDPLDYLPER